jgi:hypothetical protein
MGAVHEASMEVRDDARALRAESHRIRAQSEALRSRCLEGRHQAYDRDARRVPSALGAPGLPGAAAGGPVPAAGLAGVAD